jgi:iron complex outermembrane recepter protein
MKRNQETLASAFAVIASAFVAAPAGAQAQESVGVDSDEIVVTGTRIRQANLESLTPTVSIGVERLEANSDVEIGGLLRDLPVAGVAAATPQSTSSLVTTSFGLSSFNLRNLTENRTLVLVDDKRFVTGIPGQNIVDLNAIPVEMIERVDVVTGGASAVYGSDALAGVVNIVLRDDLDGVIFTGQGGRTEQGDAETFRTSVVAGSSFADGRGHALVSLGWSKENGAFARDRGFLATDSISLAAIGAGSTDDIRSVLSSFLSSFSERGRFNLPNGPQLTVDDAGVVRPFSIATDGFNRNSSRALSAPIERYSAAFNASLDLSSGARWFGQFMYSATTAQVEGEGFPLDGFNIYGANNPANTQQCADFDGDGDSECKFGIPILSAIVPDDIRLAAIAANPTIAPEDIVIGFRRRMTEVGTRNGEATRQTFRLATGFEGDLSERVSYEASLTYGRTTSSQASDGQVNVVNARRALDVVVGPGGVLQCREEIARLEGCVPLNIFGRGRISSAAAAYVSAENARDALVDQVVLNGYFSGDTFKMPAGPVRFVAGAEYREERSSDTPDRLTQTGLNASNITPPTKGSFNVSEVFGELKVPLVADAPFMEALDVGLAVRLSDYSSVGFTDAYATTLDWRVTGNLRLRGQYARAVRAPNISELFQGPQQTFPALADPCQGLTRSGGQAAFFNDRADPSSGVDPATVGDNVATRCLADPNLAARVTRDGFFIPSQPELQGVSGFTSGNPALDAETADTFTAGLVYEAAGTGFGTFTVSLDYYNIAIENAISTFGRQLTVDNCYSGGEARFCSLIRRADAGDFVGFLAFVDQRAENLAELNAEGVDAQFSYSLPLSALLRGAPASDTSVGPDWGTIGFNVIYSHLIEQSDVPIPGAGLTDNTGELGAPEHRANVSVSYEKGPLTLRWDARIIGAMNIENDPGGAFEGARIGVRHFHDLQVVYDISERLRFILGVDNLLDEYVFVGGTAGEVAGSLSGSTLGHRTVTEIYDGLGRRGFAAVRLRF